jgi:ATP-dependent helicase/nuclease subunit B
MAATVVTSVASRPRIDHARAWLETRDVAEEVLIIGASLNAANELARSLAKIRGAAFGWHRLTLAQLVLNIAGPELADREIASISQIGAEATVTRLLHRLRIELRLGRFQRIAHTPGFPRAIAGVLQEL